MHLGPRAAATLRAGFRRELSHVRLPQESQGTGQRTVRPIHRRTHGASSTTRACRRLPRHRAWQRAQAVLLRRPRTLSAAAVRDLPPPPPCSKGKPDVTGAQKRVLLVQPSLQPPGGGNGVAAWMLEALKRDHSLSLLSWHTPDLNAVNRFFGTSLHSSDFRLIVPPRLARVAARCSPTPLALLKNNYLSHLGRRLARDYDVILTANNESDLGGNGIQYIHFPSLHPIRPEVDLHWYHPRLAVSAYRRYAQRLTGFSNDRMRSNLTLVNSDWTGNLVRRLHGVEPRTVRPPVPGRFPAVPWREREDGFVCIGRISPEKRIELIVEILAEVRSRGPGLPGVGPLQLPEDA